MNVYEKLNKCRIEWQGANVKKSGKNKFANYTYYELADILPVANKIFDKYGIFTEFSILEDYAQIKVTNVEKMDEFIIFTTPIADASVKGCSPIQNLGGVHTYLKRYLYQNVLEIVESDIVDGNTEKNEDYRLKLADYCKKNSINPVEVASKYGLSKKSKNDEYKKALDDLTGGEDAKNS